MPRRASSDFLGGVIEGFYGPPWTQAERFELFDWMVAAGLNTYFYGPKDDLKHRASWRETYTDTEAAALADVIRTCQERGLRFIYALGPGLDIRFGSDADLDHLKQRFQQLLALGCGDFALLFDDIPDRMDPADRERWGSFAAAQAHVANQLFHWTRERSASGRFLFCPTPYCGRMAERKLGGEGYLATLGRELHPDIDVFWTGPEIISREITVAHVQELRDLLQRSPVIWDNLHANDYDGRRFYCGPYSGRPPELREHVAGILCNPNTEFPLNFVPIRTLGDFLRCRGSWEPRAAYLAALQAWLPRFATVGQPAALEDLILLGDCYYLPHEDGPEAAGLLASARALLASESIPWGDEVTAFRARVTRLRDFCTRLAELRHRPLFCALSRRIWELREELELLERYLQSQSPGGRDAAGHFDFHLPSTYRGGFVARLQGLLVPAADGTFAPAP